MRARSGAAGSPAGGRQARDDRFENLGDAAPFLGAREDRAVRVEADDVLDLAPCFIRIGAGQIDLVDDRDDLQIVLDREVGVRERLRLDALRRVHEQERALAGGQRTGHFVGEIDVTGRVDEIEDVVLAVSGRGYRRRTACDLMVMPALALEVHGVEHLRVHLARLQRARQLEKAIGQRGFAVVDVRDDGKITDEALIHARPRCVYYVALDSTRRPARRRRLQASGSGLRTPILDFGSA